MAKNDMTEFGLTEEELDELRLQCQNEIAISEDFMRPKWEKWRRRIKLLNNQKKRDTDISEPLAHVHFDTVLSALRDDELKTTFLPRAQGDEVQTENLNPVYEYDCELMDKKRKDYFWNWNALFFGRALLGMHVFDRQLMCPKPTVINMLTWYRDPQALSVNGGDDGFGAMRFGGMPVLMTRRDLEKAKVYKCLDEIQYSANENDVLRQANEQVRSAAGFTGYDADYLTGENEQATIMNWYTWWKGKRVLVGLANGNTKIIRFTKLKDQDQWPIIDKAPYPNSMSWDGTSLMDLVEDKQRAKAKLVNAALYVVETNSNHMYAYDINRVANESDLDFEMNKHVAIDGDTGGAITPIQRQQVGQDVSWMLNYMDTSAQKATGASDIQQGSLAGVKRTATEIATANEGADTRFSMLAEVIEWSEIEFARYWYKMYKMYFNEAIDEKFYRINGANGVYFRKLEKKDLITSVDPSVSVKSRVVGEARRIREIQEFNSFFELATQDPSVNVNELIRKRARLSGMNELEMEYLFKPDSERVLAKSENKGLSDNKFLPINESDDDLKHIQEHAKAGDTKANRAHQKMHWMAYLAKNKNPNLKQSQAMMPEGKEDLVEGGDVSGDLFNQIKTIQTA